MMVREVLVKSMASSSMDSYRHHLNEAHRFLMNRRATGKLMVKGHNNMFALLPYSTLEVLTFLTHKLYTGLMPATVQNYASAISFTHKLFNMPDPTDNFLFTKFLAGMKKDAPKRRSLDPVTRDRLEKLCQATERVCKTAYDKLLYKCLMSMMYFGCLRISEVTKNKRSKHTIRKEHLKVQCCGSEKHLLLHFKTFKHSKESKTMKIGSKNHSYCPVHLYEQYVQVRPPSVTAFVDYQGRPLSRSKVAAVLARLSHHAGLSHLRINTHSFRVGRTTDLAMSGKYSDSYIRAVGRWSSSAYQKYIRPILLL